MVDLLTAIADIGRVVASMSMVEHTALKTAAEIVQEEAKRVIGTYDYGWPSLAESTLARKGADTPLLETGEMRDSIEYTVEHRVAYVGSNNPKATWQELGTKSIPPRSFLMGAAMHMEEKIHEETGALFAMALNFSAPLRPDIPFRGNDPRLSMPSRGSFISRGKQ